MKKRVLGLVSTNYHLLVFLFIKDAYLQDADVDLVVTDKTASLYELYTSGRLAGYFRKTFFADAKKIKNPYKGALTTLWESFFYNPTTKAMLLSDTSDFCGNDASILGSMKDFGPYDDFYFASPGVPDEVAKELIKTTIKQNKHINFHRFEDGFASYTKPPVCAVTTPLGQKLYKLLMGYDIKTHENELLMFAPKLAESNVSDTSVTGFSLKEIPNSTERIQRVTEVARQILNFESKSFSQRVMFLGQGTKNGMQDAEKYRSLIYEIADKVGYDDFIVKPHPRGQHDRFDDNIAIYKDSCPFELTVADGHLEDKVLISYYSTACVSGKLLFHSKCKIIFLYPLSDGCFNEKCDYEDYFAKLSQTCENVHIARTKKQLWELLNI